MNSMVKGKILEKIYILRRGRELRSARDLYEKARKIDTGITLEMVSKWIRAQPNKQKRSMHSKST